MTCHPERLDIPLHWKKPRMIFVNSMSDTFHDEVPCHFIEQIHHVIRDCPQHTFQVLTKRIETAAEFYRVCGDPPPNLWLGVTAEDQQRADERIPILLNIPAAVRFVSLEPLLGPIEFDSVPDTRWADKSYINVLTGDVGNDDIGIFADYGAKLDWVIVGCESGPKRRECKIEWIESIVQQCAEADVPCFVKQVSINGRMSKNPDEWPEQIRVRQWPGR